MSSEIEPTTDATGASTEIRRWILWILGAQIVIALFLFGADVSRMLPRLLSPSAAPGLADPIAPGDQTRRYAPRDVTQRAPRPGTRPLPSTADMPTRLLFETAAWEGGTAMTLTGEIAEGDGTRFADWLGTLREMPPVAFLDSPGGSVADALQIGRALRAAGVATAMAETDVCLSACPYMLAAGIERTVAEGAWVGVHQHYFGENTALPAFLAVEDIQRGQAEVMGYLIEMGIDPAVMRHAMATPPDEIYLLLPEELESYRFVTTDG